MTELPPEPCTGLEALQEDVLMIFSVLVSIKEIVAKGRDFPWPRPEESPRCEGHRIWCHGFVTAFFDGFSEQGVLRRWRCPECRCVMRARPSGYLERLQASVGTFRFGVIHDLVGHVELEPGERERLIRQKCDRKWVIPFSDKTRITRSTILRWRTTIDQIMGGVAQ